jgi:hypothetical protein
VHCSGSTKNKLDIYFTGGSLLERKTIFLNEIDLDYFKSLALVIKSGRFCFGSTRKTSISKLNGKKRLLSLVDQL